MAKVVYVLCAVMSILSVMALFRGYRRSQSHLLLWSCLSFGLLAVNNLLLFYDMIIIPTVDVSGPYWRNLLSAAAGSVLLFGLIWEIS